ncbi:hypothetical protein EZMO1_3109 [Endozoicomonas montiporae CL-33]|uniref:Uncharacterized protein n=1 Tax=Endozoicomonas montiporae CL-33 TaxID=570277 RepID=A0A142BEE5_9GAMM|nr:hypothetical protein EZMO1_3109 [Endozoicomonas montiporae CL-33]
MSKIDGRKIPHQVRESIRMEAVQPHSGNLGGLPPRWIACAEHVTQLGGESPLSSQMRAKD